MAKVRMNEVKIGVMVTVGLFLLAIMVLMVGSFHTLQPGYRVHVGFTYTSGLAEGAPVYLSGVEVGQVEAIDFVREENPIPVGETATVAVVCWVPAWALIPQNSRITVNTLGLMGEKYVEIIPGDSPDLLSENGYIRGIDPLSTAQVFDKAYQTLESINTSFQGLGEVLGDTGVQRDLRETVANARIVSENARAITEDFSAVLSENREDIRAATGNLRLASERMYTGVDQVAADFEAFSGRINRLGEENEAVINTSIANFHTASESLKTGVDQMVADMTTASGGVRAFVEEHQEDLDEIVVNLRESSAKINMTLDTVQSIADKVDRGEGALGMLVNDENMAQDLRDTVENLSSSSENINNLIQEIRRQPRRFVRFSIF